MSSTQTFNNDDMIITNKNGQQYTGSYKLNNVFTQNHISPYTLIQHGGSPDILMHSIFNNLAVPTGLLYLQQTTKTRKEKINSNHTTTVEPTLYSSLLELVGTPIQKKKSMKKRTRKHKKNTKNTNSHSRKIKK